MLFEMILLTYALSRPDLLDPPALPAPQAKAEATVSSPSSTPAPSVVVQPLTPSQSVPNQTAPSQTAPSQTMPAQVVRPAAPAFDLLPAEQQVIDYTNSERARYGLPPLMMDPSLMSSARRHCIWMTQRNSLTHGGGVAENIAMGQPSAASAVRDWMNSSGHRANILNRGYSRIGVAGYSSPNGMVFWCQQFR